jgi:hypothetical protein
MIGHGHEVGFVEGASELQPGGRGVSRRETESQPHRRERIGDVMPGDEARSRRAVRSPSGDVQVLCRVEAAGEWSEPELSCCPVAEELTVPKPGHVRAAERQDRVS